MSNPFVAEIRMFAGNFAPTGWAFCNGQLMPISQNTALFSLLGTNYGGDGRSTFGLPNLSQRMPIHAGSAQGPGLSDYVVGQSGGDANVTLLPTEIPQHSHAQQASNALASVSSANGSVLAKTVSPNPPYHAPASLQPLGPNALSVAGGNQPHNNLQPFLEVTFIIALQGVFPARN